MAKEANWKRISKFIVFFDCNIKEEYLNVTPASPANQIGALPHEAPARRHPDGRYGRLHRRHGG